MLVEMVKVVKPSASREPSFAPVRVAVPSTDLTDKYTSRHPIDYSAGSL